jgi:hypothetical protein
MVPDKPKVLVIARMAGAASALAPVARILIDDDFATPVVVGFEHAEPVFREHELPLWAFENSERMPEIVDQIYENEQPKLVLTGTSAKPKLDLALWSHARANNIPTVAVLDHWMNYSERFADEQGSYRSAPDAIAVMDEVAYREMAASGCPTERLVVTGQPAFDEFTNLTPEREQQLRHLSLRELGVDEGEMLLVFASDPRAGRSLQLFLDAAQKSSMRLPNRLQVIVKLHPLETALVNDVVRRNRSFSVRALRHFPQLKLIAAADLVVGMDSVLLLEAALMGKRAISVQPSGAKPSRFLNHLHYLIERTQDIKECEELIVGSLNEEKSAGQRRRELALAAGFDGKAGRRVGKLLYDRLGIAPAVAEAHRNKV